MLPHRISKLNTLNILSFGQCMLRNEYLRAYFAKYNTLQEQSDYRR